jgi:predicted transposase YdaD
LISDHGKNVAVHIEAMLEPKQRELGNFKTKNALLEETLKRPVVTVILYLEKGKYETFPYIYETQAGLLKNSHVFARILLWEHKDRILSGELKELAPFLQLCEDEPDEILIERTKQLIKQTADANERSNLLGVAILVAYRKYKDKFRDKEESKKFVKEKFKEEYAMLKESDFITDWLEESEQKGREEGKRSLLLALLAKKFGKLSPHLRKQIRQLSGTKLDNLSLALLDLKNVKQLQAWLANGKATPSAN